MDRQRRVLLVSVALLAGAATSLAFAPADWIPLAVLGPALGLWAAVEARTGVLGAVCGLAYGIAWSFSTLHWMFELDPLAAVALAFIQSVFWAPTGAVAAVGAQRLGPAWWVAVTSATWTVSEAARARIPLTGFEWGQLSMATVGLPLRRAASVVGALGMTGLVVALAAVLVVLTWRRDGHVARVVAGLLVVIAAMVGLGTVTWTTSDGQLAVAVIQVDDPCPGDFAADCPGYIDALVEAYVDSTQRLDDTPDLIVWGEDALPGAITRQAAGAQLIAIAGDLPAPVLAGVGTPIAPGRFLRWAALFGRDGSALDGYAKRMPVPFGEYVPLREVLGGISDVGRLVPSDLEAGDDTSPVVVHTDGTSARFGTVVSWEVIFARAVRAVAGDANGLATLTTVASYGTSAASDQLLAAARLRAVEHQKPMIVAATTGRSALIDSGGRVEAASALFQADQLTGSVALRSGLTPYARVGDGLPIAVAVAVLLAAWLRTRREAQAGGRPAGVLVATDDHAADRVAP